MKYQVGRLVHYTDEDPIFDSRTEADAYALEVSASGLEPMGVWTSQDDGSDLLAIAHEGELFTN